MTKSALELKKLEEEKRHNLANENVEQGKLDETIKKRGTDRMLGLGNIAAKMMGATAKNELSWYTYFFDLIMSQLKQSVDCYAGYTVSIAGRSIQILENTYDPVEGYDFKQNIISFKFMPTIGAVDSNGNTTAEASKNFNTKVRGSNSGSTNYDAIDLFKYPLAMDSPSYMLQWLYRGMALCNYKDVRDPSSTNYSLLLAHCYNDTNIMRCFLQRRAALVDLYNDIVLSLNVMNIPFNMPYILRHNWLCSTVFKSNSGVASEYYIVNPEAYFVYHEATGSLKAMEVYRKIRFYGNTPDDILWGLREMFHEMLVPLTNSQAMGTMTGDINKAFGDGIKYPYLSLENLTQFGVAFVSDIKYLQSFKNADIVPIKGSNNTGEFTDFTIQEGIDANLDPFLYQGTYVGYVWNGPELDDGELERYISAGGAITSAQRVFINDENQYIDYYDDEHITEEDQVYNLSFRNTYDVGINYFRLHSSRSEIITDCAVFQYNETGRVSSISSHFLTNIQSDIEFNATDTVPDFIDNYGAFICRLAALGSYEFMPRIYIVWPDPNNNRNRVQLIWNRNHNRNRIYKDLVIKIQRSALLSMFMPTSSQNPKPGSDSSNANTNKKNKSNKGKKPKKGKKPNKSNGKEDKENKEDKPAK